MSREFLLDVSRLVWRAWGGVLPTGIDRTCLAYAAHYQSRAQAVVQSGGFTRVLSSNASEKLYGVLLTQGTADARARLMSRIAPALISPRESDLAGRLYLNVGHTGLDKPGHTAWLQRTNVRPIYFIHDLIPLTHPEYCRPGEPEKHTRRITALLQHGTGIISNSKDTLDEVAAFAGLLDALAVPSALVAPLGADLLPSSPDVSSVELPSRPYFVMLGTIEGRKNHLLMLTLWADLARRLGQACPQLVIIGRRGWECEQAVDMLERSAAIRGNVMELSRCDDVTLDAYMRGAKALLFPSFVEGYGLPLVEALACGTPVIASDLNVFRELAGEVPDYLSPIDGLGWSRTIEDYARPASSRRDAQLARLASWHPPTWADHFAKVDRWLEQFTAQP